MQHTVACDDCVVGVLLQAGSQPVEIDEDEAHALENLAEVGLVPRLRLIPRREGPDAAAG